MGAWGKSLLCRGEGSRLFILESVAVLGATLAEEKRWGILAEDLKGFLGLLLIFTDDEADIIPANGSHNLA